jgi:hypothetical protein
MGPKFKPVLTQFTYILKTDSVIIKGIEHPVIINLPAGFFFF